MTHARPPVTDQLIDVLSGRSRSVPRERRAHYRHPYSAVIAVVLVGADGTRSQPMALRAKNISLGGVGVIGRQMMHPGQKGAIQLVRSDGSTAVVGVQVKHCRYVGGMDHESGLQFMPMPQGIEPDDLLDGSNRLKLMHPSLKQNIIADPQRSR